MNRACLSGITVLLAACSLALAQDRAQELVDASGHKAGLAVHLGVTDGELTAALGSAGNFLVHGLAADDAAVETARQRIEGLGLYGRVSVERGPCSPLPYARDIVTLLVVSRGAVDQVNLEEIVRVLAPKGVACFEGAAPSELPGCKALKGAGGWTLFAKPRPEGMDDFTHFNYDAQCNRVGRDRLAEVPFSLRWLDGPHWTTGYSGPHAMVSAGGRIFTGVHEAFRFGTGKVSDNRFHVTARDAYNGKVLWKKPAPGFRRLAAIAAERFFYTVVERNGPLVALDAITGEEVRTYQDAGAADWAVLAGGMLVIGTGGTGAIKGVDAAGGKVLWSGSRNIRDCDLTPNVAVDLAKGEIYFAEFGNAKKDPDAGPPTIGCLDLATGEEKWAVKAEGFPAGKLSMGLAAYSSADAVLILGGGNAVEGGASYAYSTTGGKPLWNADYRLVCSGRPMRWKGSSYVDGYFIDGLFWTLAGRGNCKTQEEAKRAGPRQAIGWHGHDPKSGDIVKRLDLEKDEYINDSCHRTNASVRYFLGGHADFVDRSTGRLVPRSQALHNGCHFGMIPANGLWYTSSLYQNQYIQGEAGLAGKRAEDREAAGAPGRLEKGSGGSGGPAAAPEDWSCFRANPARDGASAARLPEKPEAKWAVKLGERIGPPIAAAGQVFVADLDGLKVLALNAADGKVAWSHTVGGRVYIPPTYYEGTVLFGSADGWVYCLAAESGALVWRYRAAPGSDRIVVRERLESVWPVLSGVLVIDGMALFAAGRHGTLDGGVEVYGLEPASGRLLWHRHCDADAQVRLAVSDGKSYCLGEKARFAVHSGEPAASLKALLYRRNPDEIDLDSRLGAESERDKILAQAHLRAVARAGATILTAGPPWAMAAPRRDKSGIVNYPEDDPKLNESLLCVFSAQGELRHSLKVDALPVFDGLCAAGDQAFLSTQDGKLRCFGAK